MTKDTKQKLFTQSDIKKIIEVILERKYVPPSDAYYIHKGREFVQYVLMEYIEIATQEGFSVGELRRYMYDRIVELTPKCPADYWPWEDIEEVEKKMAEELKDERGKWLAEIEEEEIEREKLGENWGC